MCNTWLGRRGALRILERVPGVKVVRKPKRFASWFRETVFCEFEIDGVRFEIEEPFGDNSRYWIGGPRFTAEFEKVAHAFRVQRKPFGLSWTSNKSFGKVR